MHHGWYEDKTVMSDTLAVCLFSGGIDSAVAAQIVKNTGDEVYLLSVNYGQVMQRELDSARRIARHLSPAEHRVVEIHGFKEISSSGRTREELVDHNRQGILGDGTIPSAYPPGRDFTFISMAAAWAETLVLGSPHKYGSAKVIIGTNFTDTLDYPDCQEFVYERFTDLLNASLKMSVALGKRIGVLAPLIRLTKQEVVFRGQSLGIPLELTWSCYSGAKLACGRCDACRIRYFAFERSGLHDEIEYEVAPSPLEMAEVIVSK
jgi:7-cyano-7-deazaguanine synthase